MRRRFDREFRAGAVRIVRETGKPIAQVARDLGINEGTLGNWVNADRRARGEGAGGGRARTSVPSWSYRLRASVLEAVHCVARPSPSLMAAVRMASIAALRWRRSDLAGSIEDVNAGTELVPRFTVGEGYAVYRGPTTDSAFHCHAAFQIAIAVQGEVAMVDASATQHRAVALVVPPMARHRMLATAELLTFFVEPHCVFADRLRKRYADGITAAPELHDLREEDVGPASVCPSSELDPRLMEALNTLRDRSVPMPSLAATVGLSPQRLRALARHQVGMPLARWRVWARLRRAAEALRAGQSPADAAITAGFADQAHLTRRMREMVGLTPAAVLPVLRDHSRRAT